MQAPAARSRLFHSIVVVGLGTVSGGCGSAAPTASNGGAGGSADVDASDASRNTGSLEVPSADASSETVSACCNGIFSCPVPAGDGGGASGACCIGDGGDPHQACCPNFTFSCPPQASDGGDAGVVCGCWPLFV